MPPRDSQRSKVYQAERVLTDRSVRFADVDDLRGFIESVMTAEEFQRRWPTLKVGSVKIKVRRGLGGAHAQWHAKTLTFGSDAMTDRLALHEVAHLCTSSMYGPSAVPAHGWQYVATYLDLMRLFRPGWVEVFTESCRQHRVRWEQPRVRRHLTESQQHAAAFRLAAARQVKDTKHRFRREVTTPENGWTFNDTVGGAVWEIVPLDPKVRHDAFVAKRGPFSMPITYARRVVRRELEELTRTHPGAVFQATFTATNRFTGYPVIETWDVWHGPARRAVDTGSWVASGQSNGVTG